MLKDSPKRVGEKIQITISLDPESREIKAPASFVEVLDQNEKAKIVFDRLPPSRKLEIVRYLANLKTKEARERNIQRAINFLLGKDKFAGRDKP